MYVYSAAVWYYCAEQTRQIVYVCGIRVTGGYVILRHIHPVGLDGVDKSTDDIWAVKHIETLRLCGSMRYFCDSAPQTSPIKNNNLSVLYSLDLLSSVRIAFGIRFAWQPYPLTLSLVSSSCAWSQTFVLSVLPILLTADTVASDYALPAIGARSGLAPVRLCQCRAN